jgi:2-keto-4-pentenoate hydratase/2-oxohepta-3-ene-1,7-dioic acid hydratase in catechol pathway
MRFANVSGRGALVVGEETFDVADLSNGDLPADPMTLIASHWDEAARLARGLSIGTGQALSDAHLLSPVPLPGAIFGVVANYPPALLPVPAVPMVFGKFASAVAGPFDDIRLPNPARLPMRSEWTVLEAELAVVVGAGGRHIAASDAFDHVAGFVAAQDITERVHEFGPHGTSVGTMNYLGLKALGKSLDSFCPLGPVLVTVDELDNPNALNLECRLNGRVVQKASTAEMLMDVADLVAFLSAFVTLRPGDVILTGTPTALDGPLPRLAPGDVIETEIAGIGALRNTCVRDE